MLKVKSKKLGSVSTGKSKGFGLIEVLIALFIMMIISVIGVRSFATFRTNNALEIAHDTVVTALSEARNFTLFSKDATVYSVRFASSSVTRFTGLVYQPSDDDNEVYELSPLVNISHLGILPFSYNIGFERLTGIPTSYGTITISVNADASKQKTVFIGPSGLSE